MKYDGRRIANSFYLPRHPLLRGIASMLAFTRWESREFADRITSRSLAESLRIDWEATGDSMWWAVGEVEKDLQEKGLL